MLFQNYTQSYVYNEAVNLVMPLLVLNWSFSRKVTHERLGWVAVALAACLACSSVQ